MTLFILSVFLLGLMLGGAFGALFLALCVAAREDVPPSLLHGLSSLPADPAARS